MWCGGGGGGQWGWGGWVGVVFAAAALPHLPPLPGKLVSQSILPPHTFYLHFLFDMHHCPVTSGEW